MSIYTLTQSLNLTFQHINHIYNKHLCTRWHTVIIVIFIFCRNKNLFL